MDLQLPPWPLLGTFILASSVLAVTPGPGVLYIVTRSLVQGRRCGLASVAGVALGNFGNAVAAGLGLAALFAVSAPAFALVKYAGAAYLIYLGVQALRAPRADPGPIDPSGQTPVIGRIFRDGILVALLNPKTTLFFAAFLPQFMLPQASQVGQSLPLGALFVLIAALSDTVYALAAGSIAPALQRAGALRRLGPRLSAATFIALGVLTALSSTKAAGK